MKMKSILKISLLFAGIIVNFFLGDGRKAEAYAGSEGILPALADTPFVKIPHKAFEIPCEACHTTDSWKPLKKNIEFDHGRTGFILRGTHNVTSCSGCHAGGKFNATVRECSACHTDAHQGQLGTDCQRCHNEDAWAPSIFSHNDQTFLMIGAHRGLDCADCHKNLSTFKMPNINDCADCHRAAGVSPQHSQYEMLGDCRACHSNNAWNDYPHFDGWFTLTSHHRVTCERCHKNAPNYQTYTCRDCHGFDQQGQGD
jgi:hypothetical protein